MAQKQISRFPLNEKFSGLSRLSGLSRHVPNYAETISQFKLGPRHQVPCVEIALENYLKIINI